MFPKSRIFLFSFFSELCCILALTLLLLHILSEIEKQSGYLDDIDSSSSSILDSVLIAGKVNSVKNAFGKPMVVVIKSQMGAPIYAFSGNKVYWEVQEDLPKFTKLMIDGKALYIHRANFQIIDKGLLD